MYTILHVGANTKKKIKKIISIKMSAISIAKIASLKHVKPLSF